MTRSEYKLADSITALLKEPRHKNLIEGFTSGAKGRSLSRVNMTAAAAYKLLSDSLLDGMPCDHANVLITESDEGYLEAQPVFALNYWSEVGGDIAVYYALREALGQGFSGKHRFSL